MSETGNPRLPESIVLEAYRRYLSDRGCASTKIPESKTKTPDLEVILDGTRYLNEFKAPDHVPVGGMYLHRTTHSKIVAFVHKAVKQFKAYDPDHRKPWVVTFSSAQFQLNWNTFREVLQGGSVLPNGQILADFRGSDAFRRFLVEDREHIDLYIWLQATEDTGMPFQASFFTYVKSSHLPTVEQLTAQLRRLPVSTDDHHFGLV